MNLDQPDLTLMAFLLMNKISAGWCGVSFFFVGFCLVLWGFVFLVVLHLRSMFK